MKYKKVCKILIIILISILAGFSFLYEPSDKKLQKVLIVMWNKNIFDGGRLPIKNTEIKYLISSALTDKINDREVYMKGIDASYSYEGYSLYKINELNF